MTKLWSITLCALLAAIWCTHTLALPLQELPPRKGHVPVYIRVGDTPLAEIHPKLAEAFHEPETPEAPPMELLDGSTAAALNAVTDAVVAQSAVTTSQPLTTESDIADESIMH